MNEVIKIDFEKQTVSARDLYDEVNNGKERFSKWFDRQIQYGFVENEDYSNPYQKVRVQKEGNRDVSRDVDDYDLSIDMAKQICMIQKTDKARKVRQYLIDLEKAWNTPEQVMARALKMADVTIKSLEQKLDEQRPLVEFANHVTGSSNSIDIGDLSKVVNNENIDIGRNKLFSWLRENKYLMSGSSKNIPYQKYIDNGYFEVIEYTYNTPYGMQTGTKTKVKGKGQVCIVEKLRKEFA